MCAAKFSVVMTYDAEADLTAIYNYITDHDGTGRADEILDKLLVLIEDLSTLPERGTYPKELITLGIQEYRQVLIYHYRIIYRVFKQQVVIYLIVDGRRDLQLVLAKRLLGQ